MSAAMPPPAPGSTPARLRPPADATNAIVVPRPVVRARPLSALEMPAQLPPSVDIGTPLSTVAPQPLAPGSRPRRSLLLVAAVLAVVALGVGALFVSARGDDQSSVSAGEYSLSAAARQTADANTMAFDIVVSMGSLGSVSMRGAIDGDAQLMTMTMDTGSMLDGAEGSMELIVDIAGGVTYMSGAAFPSELLGSATWVSADLEELAAINGQSLDELRGQLAMDPGASAELLLDDGDLGEVTEIGVEEIDGEQLMRYQVSVATADAMAANPQLQQQLEGSAGLGLVLPETIVYDAWVAGGNELRRMVFEMPMMGETTRMQIDYHSVGEPVDVTIPSGSDVIDMNQLAGS